MDSGSTATYKYNAQGQWVERFLPNGSWTFDHLFGVGGEDLGVYSAGTAAWFDQDISMGGRTLVDYGSPTRILHTNNLGTTTVTTDQTGTELQDQLFYPWGQQWTLAGQPYMMHFAGMQNFEDPGLVYPTDFRKYNPALGRWMSPDPLGEDVTDPQSLNRYSYVENNPCGLTDPLGLSGGCGQNPFAGPGSSASELGLSNLRPGRHHGGGSFDALRIHKGVTSAHGAVDLAASPDTPVFGLLPGKVVSVGSQSYAPHDTGAGLSVSVSAGGGYFYRYFHLSRVFVHEGDVLNADSLVGLTGMTGLPADYLVSEAHLHLQIQRGPLSKDAPRARPFNFMTAPCPKGVHNFPSTGGGTGGGGYMVAAWIVEGSTTEVDDNGDEGPGSGWCPTCTLPPLKDRHRC